MHRTMPVVWVAGIAVLAITGCGRQQNLPAGNPSTSQQASSAEIAPAEPVLFSATIDRRGDPIFLPVTIQSQPYRFMLDSGATHHFYDAALRHLLGTTQGIEEVVTSGQTLSAQTFEPAPMNLGDMPLDQSTPVVCTDLSVLRMATGLEVHGLLGMPLLEEQTVRIDWDRGKLEILENDSVSHGDWGEAVDVTRGELAGPMIDAVLPDERRVSFLVDTGANTTGTLAGPLFRKLVENGLLEVIGSQSLATASGVVTRDKGRLRSLRIGDLEYQGLIFSEGNGNNLGLRFLRRHSVIFDLPHDKIYLRPAAAAFGDRDMDDMSGLRLISIEGRSLVYTVQPGGPADRAGVQRGDEVISVDGRAMSELSLGDLRTILRSEPGRQVSLQVIRDSQALSFTFNLLEEPWN